MRTANEIRLLVQAQTVESIVEAEKYIDTEIEASATNLLQSILILESDIKDFHHISFVHLTDYFTRLEKAGFTVFFNSKYENVKISWEL